ncbi:tRNA (adenosine(37)-N6)-threonylcarbamoyltransferase complex ATPase subunit type 1 TsaE [Poseidonocella sedimentorum]|uniref:tRNA threonylcarbamoyladenosine biosynthesis protein TsaE n=1 Tax=Poseidonocella sedimentorum TaxID=871652 RepID=A0A1I6D6X5_9RHOB|nr:tRNA (adenosine(37)-N6)-threonylcarbamoyltransferase complex ATPase subunit type 1 TsaE [Poseidonocella sedimentorum]SFR01215.1 tRNA threonylcarbamoyladenosine biosynthesis protein TsaE [Poseidonocella sedimentorum]
MAPTRISIPLPDPDATDALARRLAALIAPGRTILLEGQIGAGKSHFARALIRAELGLVEVPSPTFTLVQSYEAAPCDIWHADLYRLGDPGECIELGLTEAFEEAFCLVEWPDRLGALRPDGALTLRLDPDETGEGRRAHLEWSDPAWDEVATLV